ncbi:hypothetical protein ABES25_23365 [Bacillus gobiensis]|uniref:hypothetical protein n=1 Tax=Bacillus gobiensis TaxID=1441095 RepID=UPI003D2285E7
MKRGIGAFALVVMLFVQGCAANEEQSDKNRQNSAEDSAPGDAKQSEKLTNDEKASKIVSELEQLSKEILNQYQDTKIDSIKANQQNDSTAFTVEVKLSYNGVLTQSTVLSHAAELARHLSKYENEGYVKNLTMQWKLADEKSYGTNLTLVNEGGELRLKDGDFAEGVE